MYEQNRNIGKVVEHIKKILINSGVENTIIEMKKNH